MSRQQQGLMLLLFVFLLGMALGIVFSNFTITPR